MDEIGQTAPTSEGLASLALTDAELTQPEWTLVIAYAERLLEAAGAR